MPISGKPEIDSRGPSFRNENEGSFNRPWIPAFAGMSGVKINRALLLLPVMAMF
jgi:hypothetical protein